ncbi:plastocyanin/azurin family copper-binding protein [Haloplanus aerogenes]|uniref:Copper-binding protein n=1 Tax=Haloplanus aerogenes TaxID=660522 RepID=A0A3M0EA85_9EURY|nr:plastocyanin/azurin family copper-binding protein [Haloplanus aerogenes]AZH25387.1 copper-binding protein [Haloplanus aerogenes]RMB25090.1 plastocyanin [Haloplanus aerogenes]
MNRRALLRLGGAGLLAVVAGCSAAGGSGDTRRVSMTDDFAYDPARITVDAGTTVRWTNDDDVGHTVTAYGDGIPADATYFASGDFDTERAARDDITGGLLPAGDAYEHTFTIAGTYDYFCVPHEGSGMTGTVVVR